MRTKSMRAEDLMSVALKTVHVGDDIEDAKFCMEMGTIHHLPVLDDNQELAGIVSHGVISRALAEPDTARRPIASIMEREVITVPVSMPAEDVVRTMIERRIGSVAVVGSDGTLVGIITATDLLGLALAYLRNERLTP